jgi:hypothetical protein
MILAILAIVLGGFICFCNWICLFRTLTTKKFHSVIPLIGAFFLGIGLVAIKSTRPYALLSIVADYGTMVFVLSIPYIIIHRRDKKD